MHEIVVEVCFNTNGAFFEVNMKVCLKCRKKFKINKKIKQKYCSSRCRNHVNIIKWRKNNPEKARAASRRWAKNNPEKARAASRRWEKNNPEKVFKKNKNWKNRNRKRVLITERSRYRKHRKRILAVKYQWRKNNPEKYRSISARWRRNNPKKCALKEAKWKKKNVKKVAQYCGVWFLKKRFPGMPLDIRKILYKAKQLRKNVRRRLKDVQRTSQ